MAAILRRTAILTLCALTLLAVYGCGNGATTSAPTTTSATPASSAATQTYSSKAFVVPLTVTVDAGLKSPPNPDSPNLLEDVPSSVELRWRPDDLQAASTTS